MSNQTLRTPLIVMAMAAVLVASLACSVPASFTDIGGTALATTTWYVTTTGNDSHDCLSVATACRTIAAAITKATGLAVIQIGPGTFHELNEYIDSSLHETLTGDGVGLRSRVLTLRGTVS